MKFNKLVLILLFCTFFFTLMACENRPNFAELCEEHTKICQEFQEDTWCKRERVEVGFANLADKNDANDSNKYQQLIAYEGYEKCMLHASKIEHIKLKVKKTIRIDNVVKARVKIKALALATQNSEHPDLLFFHWSRYLNEHSLNKFIALEGSELLEKPNRQINLASYYAKHDITKTLNLLYHALELYPSDAAIDTEIFQSLASIFAHKKEHKQAYIWSKILYLYSPKDSNISHETFVSYFKGNNLNTEFLDRVAKKTLNNIIEGEFKAPRT
ncbi:DUF2989 domain-containing protein [Colwellia sp. MB3u-4]|uniref:DUF2989 domain-containing protein n=1 Tax=Colwellia sp. MB3u-4 TaxID=2759822 RepID=UPI0015F4B745|nr:DUF2989 domain-containing protein [Colwellia sp. MB3u-4]MBA6289065.1 DUF2989 domain-containing protein [Colwellia sp. MB3u-4]